MARHKKFIQVLAALGLALGVSNAGAAWAAGRASEDGKESVYVQLQSTKLRADTKHWAAARANLKYGDRLIVLGAKDDWLNVKSGKTSGFVHVTAVTPREVVLQRSGKNLNASADSADIVLAGKGFGKDC